LPGVLWMHLATPATMASLAPGESEEVTLQLLPPADLTLGDYTGTLALNGATVSLTVPFSFRALSSAVGDLTVTAEDEYTYFVAGAPHVAGASVVVTDVVDRTQAATGVTDASGTLTLHGLREGYYNLDVTAADHSTYHATILITAGQVNAVR